MRNNPILALPPAVFLPPVALDLTAWAPNDKHLVPVFQRPDPAAAAAYMAEVNS